MRFFLDTEFIEDGKTMKRLCFLLLLIATWLSAQKIVFVTSLPAHCIPRVSDAVQLSVAPYGLYYCAAANTWVAMEVPVPAPLPPPAPIPTRPAWVPYFLVGLCFLLVGFVVGYLTGAFAAKRAKD